MQEMIPAAKEMAMTPYELLAMGFYLFPVKIYYDEDTGKYKKTPLVSWTKDSSNDAAKIKWWERMGGRNAWGIDCGKSGVAVMDVDSGKVVEASDNLAGLEFEYGELPDTFTVRTMSGGYHLYYKGDIRNSASSKLGKGLDTRGNRGYVVAPGSDGYEVINDIPLAPVPDWVVNLVGKPSVKTEAVVPEDVAVDSDTAVSLATRFLHNAEPAIEGLGGDLHTFKVACGIRDYGVSKEMALELMLEHWNDTCSPPWSAEELDAKIRNVYHYANQPLGAANPENVFEVFEDSAPPESTKAVKSLFIDAHDLIRKELSINYLIQDFIETPTTGLIFGDPGAGKSFLSLDMALAVAFGSQWMGAMAAQGRALYFNGEGHVGAARRIMAWLKHYGHDDIPAGLFTLTQRRIELTEKSVMQLEPHIKALTDKYGPLSLITVDTLARHLSGDADENSAKDVGGFINAVDYLKDRFQCTVAVVHHSGKMNKESSRGSSAIKGALDWEFKVAPGEIKFTKQKEGELPQPMGFVLETVELANGVRSAVPVLSQYDPTHGKSANLSSDAQLAFSILQFSISSGNGAFITEKEWRKAFYDALGDDVREDTKRQKFGRVKRQLVDSVTIKYEGDKVIDISLSDDDTPF